MATFFLHIGMNKTASSAIQKCFHDNRRKVRGATGVDYAPLPSANHTRFLQAYFLPAGRETANAARRRRRDWYEEGYDERFAAFLDYLAASARKGRDVLLSGEGATSIPPDELARLRDIALERFDRVVVLAFVRPLQAFARSACAQRISTGRPLEHFLKTPPLPNYRTRFEPFFDVFGRDNVRLRVFEPDALIGGDPFQTLLDMMEVDRGRLSRLVAPRANVTLRLTASKFLARLNHMILHGELDAGLPPPLRAAIEGGNLGRWLEAGWAERRAGRPAPLLPPKGMAALEAMRGAPFVLPREVAERVAAEGAADAQWMSQIVGRDLSAGVADTAGLPAFSDFARYDEDEIAALETAIALIDKAPRAAFEAPFAGEKTRFKRRSEQSMRALKGRRISLPRLGFIGARKRREPL